MTTEQRTERFLRYLIAFSEDRQNEIKGMVFGLVFDDLVDEAKKILKTIGEEKNGTRN